MQPHINYDTGLFVNRQQVEFNSFKMLHFQVSFVLISNNVYFNHLYNMEIQLDYYSWKTL